MNLFKDWSFSRKLMAVNACYVIPCLVLAYFLVVDQLSQIHVAQKEMLGVTFQRPLASILASASQYKLMLHRKGLGEAEANEKLEALRTQVEREFIALESLKHSDFDALEYTPTALGLKKKEKTSVENLKSEWQNIVSQTEAGQTHVNEEQFDKFVDNVDAAIAYIGTTSQLILDPASDSYFTAVVLLDLLPEAQDRLEKLVSYAVANASSRPLTEEQRIKIHVGLAQVKSDVDRISESIQSGLDEDKSYGGISLSFQQKVPPELKKFVAASRAVLRDVTTLSAASNPSEMIAAVLASGEKALEFSGEFWTLLANELDILLTARISDVKRAQYTDLALAMFSWLPIVLIATVTLRRLSKTFIKYASRLESEAALANNSSVELASASQTVSAGSTEQAAAIQETGASMSEMTSMVARSSSQAMSSQELARKVKEQTDDGCQVIERLVTSMESIQEANAQLQNISNIISAISEKTNIINDIVGKTQLLSFNASIEAARAGQHGRGFAVVAEEVGNLAQTSGNAAKEIRTLIDDSRQQVEQILTSTLARVGEGRQVTGQAQDIFTKIAKDISTISTQIESISEASREQQFGIEQIAKAMAQMDQGTQLNNSAAFSAARLSDQLLGQSRKLTSIAQTIGVLVAGKTHTARTDDSSDDDSTHLQGAEHSQAGASATASTSTKVVKLKPSSETSQFADPSAIERTVNKLVKNETELDRMAPPKASQIDANDESFKKLA